MTIAEFNALPFIVVEALLLDCCWCARWATKLSEQRPFTSREALCRAADSHWQNLERQDWLGAFSHHPQIGERAVAGSESHRRWTEGEQTGARVAAADVKTRMARGNRLYLDKFGYIYIVCATGKSAEEMLALLEERLQNEPARELPIAAEEQRKITRLRLEKLFADERSA